MDSFTEEYLKTEVERLGKLVDDLVKRFEDNDRPDSIEYGTPKGGKYKVYVNARKPEEGKKLVDNMSDLLNHAQGGQ